MRHHIVLKLRRRLERDLVIPDSPDFITDTETAPGLDRTYRLILVEPEAVDPAGGLPHEDVIRYARAGTSPWSPPAATTADAFKLLAHSLFSTIKGSTMALSFTTNGIPFRLRRTIDDAIGRPGVDTRVAGHLQELDDLLDKRVFPAPGKGRAAAAPAGAGGGGGGVGGAPVDPGVSAIKAPLAPKRVGARVFSFPLVAVAG